MSFVENLYLKTELLKLQEENKNLKKILSEAPGDRLQRMNARYAWEKYTRLPRRPYPGQHPTKYEGDYSLRLLPIYPPVQEYPYNLPDPYPGQHPVGKSTVNEAAEVTQMDLASNEVQHTTPVSYQKSNEFGEFTAEQTKTDKEFYDFFVDELEKCLSGVYTCDQQTIDSLMDRIRFYTERLRGTGY